jgi:dissimilatory sulfite reductase (desulfoviridin) alpha/beta subunit
MQSYEHDTKHWEELIGEIIDRLGIDRFVEMVAYVTDEKGFKQVAEHIGRLELLAAAEQKAVKTWKP